VKAACAAGGKKPAGAPQANGGDASELLAEPRPGCGGRLRFEAGAGPLGATGAAGAPGIGERPIGEQPRPGSGRSVLRDPVAELTDVSRV